MICIHLFSFRFKAFYRNSRLESSTNSNTFKVDELCESMFYSMSPFESNPKNNGIETDLWKISENNYEDNWNLNSSDLNRVDFFVLQESKEEIIPFVDDRMGMFELTNSIGFEQSINCEMMSYHQSF